MKAVQHYVLVNVYKAFNCVNVENLFASILEVKYGSFRCCLYHIKEGTREPPEISCIKNYVHIYKIHFKFSNHNELLYRCVIPFFPLWTLWMSNLHHIRTVIGDQFDKLLDSLYSILHQESNAHFQLFIGLEPRITFSFSSASCFVLVSCHTTLTY